MPDRYATVGRRDFRAALEYLLETEFKLVGSHRVIRLITDAVVDLQRQFYPEHEQLEPGTILWGTTKAGEQAKVSWGKRSESYGIQMVRLPLVTKLEIETRMKPGPGRDPRDNRRKEFRRDMATLVRLVKAAAAQGGLLSGAELSVLMNRSLMKVYDYIRTYERESGDPLPLKGYVLDMGSSPTHKGIICRKFEEGMSPPDIARATGHGLAAVDNYLGTYDRIKVLLKKGFDVPTIAQVTGRAARTVAQYLEIVERFHPNLLGETHREWMAERRKRSHRGTPLDHETSASMVRTLQPGSTQDSNPGAIVDPGASGEAHRTTRQLKTARTAHRRRRRAGKKPLTGQMP
ncbi:MAG TPA: DUF1670 domain-containing protein [Tepidiformaceae bacterium]|nr:DUF1670 domain-containing protein [Tepidiformaceae bacterium]